MLWIYKRYFNISFIMFERIIQIFKCFCFMVKVVMYLLSATVLNVWIEEIGFWMLICKESKPVLLGGWVKCNLSTSILFTSAVLSDSKGIIQILM